MSLISGVERNDWESEFFGRPIYRLRIGIAVGQGDIDAAVRLAPPEALLEVVLEAGGLHLWAACERSGLRLADALVDCEQQLAVAPDDAEAGVAVRLAGENDIAGLRRLAAGLRFSGRYTQPPFGPGDGARFYAAWVENAARGSFDHACLVASGPAGEPIGFASLRRIDAAACRVGLFGVDAAWRGQGVAPALWRAAGRWCVAQGRRRLLVATQTRNVAALRFYRRQGAAPRSIRLHAYRDPA